MAEEYQLLRNSVRDFAQKNIESIAVKIEQEGLSPGTARSMASQGFMGARIPTEYGGTGLDERGYMIVLEELARCSPSAAVRVLIANSLFLPLVMPSEKSREILRDVASAKISVAVDHCGPLEGHGRTSGVAIEGSRARGRVDCVLNGSADAMIVAANDLQNSLLLVKAGLKPVEEHPRLGLRGLDFSSLDIDSRDFEKLSDNGSQLIEAALNDMDLEVAAVSLGIAAGALAKAVEYSKVRTTFEHPLKDYQPVAFGLSLLRSEEEMVRRVRLQRASRRCWKGDDEGKGRVSGQECDEPSTSSPRRVRILRRFRRREVLQRRDGALHPLQQGYERHGEAVRTGLRHQSRIPVNCSGKRRQ